MSSDPISIIALVVSLVALLVTLLQAAQQYAATAYNYRHCSKRTVGGWNRHSHRRFIWSELRFEVIFTTPTILIHTQPSSYVAPEDSDAKYGVSTHNGVVFYAASEQPWFLSLEGTRAEARCSWLSLLNDASSTCLQIDIDRRKLSYDFMPDGIKKPLAQVERKSFLTLMSLFGVQWKGDSLTGAGKFCEITARDLVNFGTVYSYRPSGVQRPQKYYLVSEKARSAMFNRFDLGFHIFLTQNSDEVYGSLMGLVEEESASTVKAFYDGNAGWSPGMAETMCCFAEPEMPKSVDHAADSFMSIYSAVPTGSILRDHLVLKLLAGEDVSPSSSEVETLQKWTAKYLSRSASDELIPADSIVAAIKLACHRTSIAIGRPPIPWSHAKVCLPLIQSLDKQLHFLSHLLAPGREVQIQIEFARMQIRFGCTLFHDATKLAEPEDGFWINYVQCSLAVNYLKIASGLADKFPGGDVEIPRQIVVNRLLRGALWHIHNGNEPMQEERKMECSLSSRWLMDVSSVWLD